MSASGAVSRCQPAKPVTDVAESQGDGVGRTGGATPPTGASPGAGLPDDVSELVKRLTDRGAGMGGYLESDIRVLCGDAKRAIERLAKSLADKDDELTRAISAMDVLLAEADAVINYHVARDWPRYGMEPPILNAYDVTEPQSRALDRHRKRHAARQRSTKEPQT